MSKTFTSHPHNNTIGSGPYGPSSRYSEDSIDAALSVACSTCKAPVDYCCLTEAGYLTLHLPRLDAGRKAAKAKAAAPAAPAAHATALTLVNDGDEVSVKVYPDGLLLILREGKTNQAMATVSIEDEDRLRVLLNTRYQDRCAKKVA